jgi:hydroxymethylbilane synthase
LVAPERLRAATRGSALALWQSNHVASLLVAQHPGTEIEPVVMATTGDLRSEEPISQMGGKGVFVKEIQAAVLDGRADFAVHSAKDLPSIELDGLVIAAVPERGDPRDALVGSTLADLGPGSTVATGSIRRRAQLAHLRPDLNFEELRGNIATRLRKSEGFDAILMAVAALDRLGLEPPVVDRLGINQMVPQVGQGALAVECRADDAGVLEALAAIEHRNSRLAVDAERAFLAELGGDCDVPAGAHASVLADGVELKALLAAPDGAIVITDRAIGSDPLTLGAGLARLLLDERGGRDLPGFA